MCCAPAIPMGLLGFASAVSQMQIQVAHVTHCMGPGQIWDLANTVAAIPIPCQGTICLLDWASFHPKMCPPHLHFTLTPPPASACPGQHKLIFFKAGSSTFPSSFTKLGSQYKGFALAQGLTWITLWIAEDGPTTINLFVSRHAPQILISERLRITTPLESALHWSMCPEIMATAKSLWVLDGSVELKNQHNPKSTLSAAGLGLTKEQCKQCTVAEAKAHYLDPIRHCITSIWEA